MVTWNSVPEEPTLILVAVTTPTVILPSESCKSIPAAVTIPLTLAFLTTNSSLKKADPFTYKIVVPIPTEALSEADPTVKP